MKNLHVDILPALNDNYIFYLRDQVTGKSAVIDPAKAQPVIDHIKEPLDYIFITHHHPDHVGGVLEIKEQTQCQVVGFSGDRHRIPGIDIELNDGDSFELGSVRFLVKFIPGHTLGHCCYYSDSENALFSGDTFFAMGCGRLFEGTATQMIENFKWLRQLPKETQVFCTHEYTLDNAKFALSIEPGNQALAERTQQVTQAREQNQFTVPTTVEQEMKTNPFARWDSKEILQKFPGLSDVEIFAKIRLLKDRF